VSRFPADRIEHVKRALHDRFRTDGVSALVCAAACGADLVALKTASELGLRRRIVLPFSVAMFKKSSVIDRPGADPWDWEKMYDQFVGEAESAGELQVLGYSPEDPEVYEKTNEAILDDAFAIAAPDEAELEALVVWDARLRSGHDYTAHFLHQAERRHMLVKSIPILDA